MNDNSIKFEMKIFTVHTNILSQRKADLLLNLLPHYYKIKEITFRKKDNKGIFEIKAADLQVEQLDSVFDDFGYKCKIT